MARIYHDPHFMFATCNGASGAVDLQVFSRDDNRVVVVASDLLCPDDDNCVTVTRGIDAIATRVVNDLGYEFDFLIEHYPIRRGQPIARSSYGPSGMPESFDLVMLQWDQAARNYRAVKTAESWPWNHLGRDKAEAIIGEPFFVDYVTV
jgi:hypothetical protein